MLLYSSVSGVYMPNRMLLSSVIIGSLPFSIERFLHKQSGLINISIRRQFKTIYKFNTGKKLLEKIKRDRDFEIYKRRILTVPNFLTLSRLAISPFFPLLINSGHSNCAFGLLVYCGASDMVNY